MDIRTVITLTIAYNIILGLTIYLYQRYKKREEGLNFIALGFLAIGFGFMCLSLRNYINDFVTIIMANSSIIIGDILLLNGLKVYFRKRITYKSDIILLTVFIASFAYFTFTRPDVNIRIVIIAFYQIYYFGRIILLLNVRVNKSIKNEASIISILFVVSVIVNFLRIVFALFESPIEDFMSASLIHALGLITYQVLPFNIAIGLFWISNSLYEKELKTQAMTDGLTSLYNRKAFLKLAEVECEKANRYLGAIGYIMCDIDYFKRVNDTYGHMIGDEIIVETSERIKNSVRVGDIVGRYGGEEFIIVLLDVNSTQLIHIMETLRSVIEETDFKTSAGPIKITMSLGGTVVKERPYPLEESIHIADMALYESKNKGRNIVSYFEFKESI